MADDRSAETEAAFPSDKAKADETAAKKRHTDLWKRGLRANFPVYCKAMHRHDSGMPYFERKPFAAMQQTAPEAVQQTGLPSMSTFARSVLSEERAAHQTLDGPFECRSAVRPGGIGTILLEISAAATDGPLDMTFTVGDLMAPNGDALPADRISVTPDRLHLSPGQSTEMRITVQVPDLARPGRYQGRVIGSGSEDTALVIIVEVAPRGA